MINNNRVPSSKYQGLGLELHTKKLGMYRSHKEKNVQLKVTTRCNERNNVKSLAMNNERLYQYLQIFNVLDLQEALEQHLKCIDCVTKELIASETSHLVIS